MKEIKIEPLSLEAFQGFGEFKNLVDCSAAHIGEMPVVFYPDMIDGVMASNHATVSMVQCGKREMIIDEAEQHLGTAEFLLPLDGDIVMFVAPASATLEPDKIRAFQVPQGTMVSISAGVWHKAPFPVEAEVVHSLVILPPLTYLKDCPVVRLEKPMSIHA